MFSLKCNFSLSTNRTLLIILLVIIAIFMLVGCDARTEDYKDAYTRCMRVGPKVFSQEEWVEAHKLCSETATIMVERTYRSYTKGEKNK